MDSSNSMKMYHNSCFYIEKWTFMLRSAIYHEAGYTVQAAFKLSVPSEICSATSENEYLVGRVNNLELCATRSEEAWVTNKWMNKNDVEKSLT